MAERAAPVHAWQASLCNIQKMTGLGSCLTRDRFKGLQPVKRVWTGLLKSKRPLSAAVQ